MPEVERVFKDAASQKRASSPSSFCLLQSQVAEKGRELKELKDTLTLVLKEKEKLEEVRHGFHFLFYRLLPGLRKKTSLKSAIPLPFSLSTNLAPLFF